MSAIGPGDWVECVDAGPLRSAGSMYGDSGLHLGGVYQVECVAPVDRGWANAGEPEVVLVEIKNPFGGGYNPDRFRPIYRPKAVLIESLKTPAKREGVPA